MRLKTAIWVQAYLRRCMGEGAFAAVVRHGDDDAGAVFIKISRLDGSCQLLSPAPAGPGGAGPDRRWFGAAQVTESQERVDARLAREREFDSDHWVVEIEDREGRHFLDDSLLD